MPFRLGKIYFGKLRKFEEAEKDRISQIKRRLAKAKGHRPETADSILLYALEKPIFVIDEYTRRFAKKHFLTDNRDYRFLQNFFEKNLKKDFRLYQDFHALIVIDGKNK